MKNDDVIKEKEIMEFQAWENEITAIMLTSFKCIEHGKHFEVSTKAMRTFILSEIKKVREECYEQMSEIIGEDEYTEPDCCSDEPESDALRVEIATIKNRWRAEQRSKLQALKNKV